MRLKSSALRRILVSAGFCLLVGATAVQASTLTINDLSFEGPSPDNGAYGYQPTIGVPVPLMTFPGLYSGWTFAGGSGVTRASSAFNPPSAPFPDGSQAAFLQGVGASVTQSIGGFSGTETYMVQFSVGSRYSNGSYDGNATLGVSIDGTEIGQIVLTSSTPWFTYSSPSFTAATGAHSLSIYNLSSGDHTGFVDAVSITGTAAAVPEPSTILLAGAGLLSLGLLRRRR